MPKITSKSPYEEIKSITDIFKIQMQSKVQLVIQGYLTIPQTLYMDWERYH